MSGAKKELKRTFYRLACVMTFAVGLLASMLTLAFFTSNDEVTNRVSAADIEIAILEPEWEEKGRADAGKMQPGMIIAKDPQVLNKSDSAVFVRMRIIYNEKELNVENCGWLYEAIQDINSTDFVYWNGWYYYGAIDNLTTLEAGKTTKKLFTKVKIPYTKAFYKNFANGFEITIEAQAISAASVDGTDTDVFIAEFNRRYSLDGGTITLTS